jgi:hypothetical protein
MKKLTDKYFNTFISLFDIDMDSVLEKVKQQKWIVESFRFYTICQ